MNIIHISPPHVSLDPILQRIGSSPFVRDLADWARSVDASAPASLHLRGVTGSLPAFFLAQLQRELKRPLLCIQADPDAAAYLQSDLEQILGEEKRILLLPPTGHKPYDDEQVDDPAPIIQRADVLQQLAGETADVVVASVDALFERVPPADTVEAETLVIDVNEDHPPERLVQRLMDQQFARVEFVEEPGEVALRGGILDVFPFSGDYPLRLEFFGDEVDSIREFDVHTQRSISRLTQARIVPNLERRDEAGGHFTSLFDYLPDSALLVTFDEGGLADRTGALYQQAGEAFVELDEEQRADHAPPETLYLDADTFRQELMLRPRLLFGAFTDEAADEERTFDAKPQPAFNSNIRLLKEQVEEYRRENVDTYILCDSRGQESRLHDLLTDTLPPEDDEELPDRDLWPEEEAAREQHARLVVESLHEGFVVPSLQLAVFTDHQIFNRYHRPTSRKRKSVHGGLTVRQVQDLNPGDFVVHVDYGVGKFAGMETITVRGKQQEAVRVLFRDEDVLYVNVSALYKLHKYSGKEGHQPRLTKLGSGQWERTKSKTKKQVKTIARDLIKLYAERKASQGYAFSSDSVWQREMEASFQYEDTPDQGEAAEAVKRDMEDPIPMDRLVCGDVGFGKTEIAVRAAFKAAQDGKQVAVLVPTTILATQHYETLTERMDKYPVRVGIMSRFVSTAEQKKTIQGLKDGTVDVVVGTHRLASKDVEFKDLGLLIIDEEQRFGVKVKERLRKMRVDVDTLTLTATPIPRTLQFSLLGARDLSIISTPPPNRQPINTEIHTFDADLIRDAIIYERSRGGQVFFIHNRVRSIEEMAQMVRAMVPDVRVRVAHGQMRPSQLEKVMVDFIDKKFDVLLSTSIIENGLDISNANTMIINHAERFGLSELHQLRGRVGRSDRKAFCYLLVPSIHALTREAKQRLQAVEEFSELGSGFNIAMRDLDIRGAGSLLGQQQSGFIEGVGYETYHKILEEAVQELRSEEFADVFDEAPPPPASETQVDVEADAFIPDEYLSNNVERLNLYRRISEAGQMEQLAALREEMADRFGPTTEEVENLLLAAELKLLAVPLRLPKVLFKNERLFLYTPEQDADPYFYEIVFHPLLERLGDLERRYVLKDTKGRKLRAIVQDVPDLQAAKEVLQRLTPETAEEEETAAAEAA